MREIAWDESLASISAALTLKQPLENDPAECPQGRLKKHKVVHVQQSEENKSVILR